MKINFGNTVEFAQMSLDPVLKVLDAVGLVAPVSE